VDGNPSVHLTLPLPRDRGSSAPARPGCPRPRCGALALTLRLGRRAKSRPVGRPAVDTGERRGV